MSADADTKYAEVPPGFPRPVHLGALPGAQPKLLMVRYNDRYYSPGETPQGVYERWQQCEDIALLLRTKSLKSKAGKRSHMTRGRNIGPVPDSTA